MYKGKRQHLLIFIITVVIVILAILVFSMLNFEKSKLPHSLTDTPKPLFTISSGKGNLNHPLSVAISPKGYLYVTDSAAHQIQVFKTNGNYIFSFGQLGTGQGQFDTPYGVAVLPDGSVLISDMLNYRIQQFTQDGLFQKEFLPKSKGIKPGLLIVDNNEVYVSDLGSQQVMVLNFKGEVIRNYQGGMLYPQGLAKINNKLYVADAGNNLVRVYSNGNESITESITGTEGKFQLLRGLAVDNLNRILVVDSMGSQVKFMTDNGELLSAFGTPGSDKNSLQYPAGIAIDRHGKIFIADWANNRVQVWGY